MLSKFEWSMTLLNPTAIEEDEQSCHGEANGENGTDGSCDCDGDMAWLVKQG